jgi:hypothetical protein
VRHTDLDPVILSEGDRAGVSEESAPRTPTLQAQILRRFAPQDDNPFTNVYRSAKKLALLLAVVLVVFGCSEARPKNAVPQKAPNSRPVAPPPEVFESPSMQFLPRQLEVPGWRLQSDPLVFSSGRFSSYIDREADHFLRYAALDLTVGQYQRVDSNDAAVVEIFRFPDFVHAFGAYSTSRKAVVSFLDIGNESFVAPHSIHIWRGAYYVRLTGDEAKLLDPMKELAAAVVERMTEAPGKPAVFGFFPGKYRLVNSEIYSSEPAWGQPLLANSFLASFDVESEPVDGLILPAATKDEATHILNGYKAFFASNGKLLDPILNLGEDNFTAEDQYMGRVVAFRLDRFVIVFRGYRDKQKLVDLASATNQRILGTIRKQLVTANKEE